MSDEKCPHCGAVVIHYGKDDKPWFCCGNGTLNRSDACYQAEITKLRAKKAEGLTWEWVDNDGLIGGGSWFATGLPGHFEVSRTRKLRQSDAFRCYRCGYTKWNDFATEAEAKAHAEELHQQAWRELRTKWDAV